jgi:hypothetical protein
MRRLALLSLLTPLLAAACGSHKTVLGDPCSFPAPPRAGSSAGAPSPARLVTAALRRALASQDVRVDVHLSLAAHYDRRLAGTASRAGGAATAAKPAALAGHPWCLAFRGVRTRAGLSGQGVLEQTETRTQFALVLAHQGFYLRLHGRWFGTRSFSTASMFSSEDIAGVIPQRACVHAGSEGCDKVDIHPLVTRGLLGHTLAGHVGRLGKGWLLVGTLNPEGFVRLMGTLGDPASYDPYAHHGRALFGVGADGRPNLFELRWHLDRLDLLEHNGVDAFRAPITSQSVHLRIALTRWGHSTPLVIPTKYAPLNQNIGIRLFSGLELVTALYG